MSLRSRLAILIAATAFGFQAVLSPSRLPKRRPRPRPRQSQAIALPTVRVQAAAPRKLRRVRRATPAARTTQRGTPVAPPPQSAQSAQGPSGSASMGSLSTAAAALPAGSSTIDARTLAQTPVASYGDIFRALPGFEVANYGQGAIGYGLSMRGYTNAEHGRDIAYYIDGVPVNDISSIHTPNYADLSVLMPETVQSIEVVRGPFDVECGDSNLGGCVNITTEEFGALRQRRRLGRHLRHGTAGRDLQQPRRGLPAVLCRGGLPHRRLSR